MKLGIMQPYLFPYIGYFQLLNAVDTFVIYDDVNYIKGGWVNRNRLVFNKEVCYFGIHAQNQTSFTKINQIEVAGTNKRNLRKLRKSIHQNYKNAPFFQEVNAIVWEVLGRDFRFINQFALYSIKTVARYLDIETKIIDSSSMYNNAHLKNKERVFSICLKENASAYINLVGGMKMYSKEYFEKRDISLTFLKTKQIQYEQLSSTFIPSLSIIDVLMYNPTEKVRMMLDQFEEI